VNATVRIEQRVWHQEVGRLKSEHSRRVLGIGDLAAQFASKALMDAAEPESFLFQQRTRTGKPRGKPMWDSGVRDALHHAARQEGCDFPGLGPHSFRRANITWRQEVGGSSIEASRIAGHNGLNVTSDYTFVSAERQNELTRRIQDRLAKAANAIRSGDAPGSQGSVSEPLAAGAGDPESESGTAGPNNTASPIRPMNSAAAARQNLVISCPVGRTVPDTVCPKISAFWRRPSAPISFARSGLPVGPGLHPLAPLS
jgi:hypothetical protein